MRPVAIVQFWRSGGIGWRVARVLMLDIGAAKPLASGLNLANSNTDTGGTHLTAGVGCLGRRTAQPKSLLTSHPFPEFPVPSSTHKVIIDTKEPLLNMNAERMVVKPEQHRFVAVVTFPAISVVIFLTLAVAGFLIVSAFLTASSIDSNADYTRYRYKYPTRLCAVQMQG
ncbi:hypothetical protein BJ138DRAFT_1104812 [Hygrophoropsis aurantiaca]|uniref:Uncharacterized protein n=1 Tax=Hygrophoropsis aurantiaca TaxID=72124 RepID=A0ACB8A2I6_9AGAM|nr:hypothetical protein BJ138DRAFT_1104812 [Hygrophoropsis aurantiaca]